MRPYRLIETDEALNAFLKHLKQDNVTTLAMDFEGEFNLHEYGEKLCLVQIFDGKEYVLVDPYAVSADLLKAFLEDRKVLKLFFGAGSDVQLVFKERQILLNSVLDLQILAEVAGCQAGGLSGLVEEVFGLVQTGKKKFQMHNWTRRPIDPEALDYALGDVEHLFALHKTLMERIVAQGKVDALVRALVLKTPSSHSRGVPGIFKTEWYKALGAAKKALFEAVVAAREAQAKDLNWPPEMVMTKSAMIDLTEGRLRPDQVPRPPRMREVIHERLVAALTAALATRSGSG